MGYVDDETRLQPQQVLTNEVHKSQKLSRQETPNSVGGQKDTADDDVEEEEEDDEEVDVDDEEEDDDVQEDDMMRWMSRMGRKMMMLRRTMLRRKTDSKSGKQTLCEPAQSKCTWTGLSQFVWKST